MAISLMLPTNLPSTSSEGSPVSLPPPTPLSPTEPYPPPPQTANSTTSSGAGDNQNALTGNINNANNINNGNNINKPANNNATTEKRKTSRRANTAERRATHNAVERQRRETLNGRFLDLAALLPNLTSVRRPSKSAIVNSSIALIHAQRRQRATAARELRTLYSQFLSLKAECDEWRLRAGVPPVEDGERSKEFISLLELRDEEEMGEEERGALRMAMSATANGGAGGNGGMRSGMGLDDDDDDEIIPHVSAASASEGPSDSETFAHQTQHVQQQQQQQQQQQLHVQAAQAQAQYQQQMRARAATFSHSPQGIPSPVHGHGHHPYATAYHSIPRPGSHGGLPPHPASYGRHAHEAHTHQSHHHGHVLPFDNGSDLILASEPHLSAHPFGGPVDIFSPTGSAPHTPGGGAHAPGGIDMMYAAGAGGVPGNDFKNDWTSPTSAHPHAGPFGHPHPGLIPTHGHPYGAFDDSNSIHSSSSNAPMNGNEGASPRSLVGGGSPLGSVSGRSREGSMAGVENMNKTPVSVVPMMSLGGGMGGGNAVMNMFF